MGTVAKLSARAVASLKEPGRHSDGDGLYLSINASGARSWVFMWKRGGRRREMGLGPARDVTLSEARGAAAEARKKLRAGIDPIEEKRRPAGLTFGQTADAYVDSVQAGWRNEKHRWQWRETLTSFCAPIRDVPVEAVETSHVLQVLQPIWRTKSETASRLRGRIEKVLDFARAQGMRSGPNPAMWRGHLSAILPKPEKLSRGHHPAMPFADVPAFVARLRERQAMAALALEFTILTAARTGETLGATWAEIDLQTAVWTIPGRRMKAGIEHRVPLCGRALNLLETCADSRTGDIVFPGQRHGRPLSNMSMEMLLRRMGEQKVTTHGFRSSFRDWAGERTDYSREIAEAALAHQIGNETERAYRRGDALEKRRALMSAWDRFLINQA